MNAQDDAKMAAEAAEIAELTATAQIVQPGDTLLVRVNPDAVTQDWARQVKQQVEERLPGVVVLVTGAHGLGAYRPARESTP